MKTLQELAKEVIAVQDASNLSGVVHAFARAILDLRMHTAEHGIPDAWKWVDHHPITQMWADKIASMTGTQTLDADWSDVTGYITSYAAVYGRVKDIADNGS